MDDLDLDLHNLPSQQHGSDAEADALSALLEMTGLADEVARYRSPLDDKDSFASLLPEQLLAEDASRSQRSRKVASIMADLLKDDDDKEGGPEPIPLVLDASDLPPELRRQPDEKFAVEKLLGAAKVRAQADASNSSASAASSSQSAGQAPQSDDFDEMSSSAAARSDASFNPEESDRLLEILTERLRQRATAEADDAAAYAELLSAAGQPAANTSSDDKEAGHKRSRDNEGDWRSGAPERLKPDAT